MKYLRIGLAVAAAAGLAWWMRKRGREALPAVSPSLAADAPAAQLDQAMLRRLPDPDPKMARAPLNPDPRMVFNPTGRAGNGRQAGSNGRKM